MARWFQYWYTQKPEVKRSGGDGHIGGASITIPYRYPEYLKADFPYFRFQAEKDFEERAILEILEEACRCQHGDQTYSVAIGRGRENRHLGARHDEPERPIGLQYRNERLLYCLAEVCKAKDRELLETCLQDAVGSPVGESRIFPCTRSPEKPWTKCRLLKLVEQTLEDDARCSDPKWQRYVVHKPRSAIRGRLNVLAQRAQEETPGSVLTSS